MSMFDQQTRPPFWRRHPVVSGAVTLLACVMLLDGWYVTVGTAAAVVLAVALRRRIRAVTLRDAGLRARADYEYRLSLAGDPRGTFGRYPPVQAGWFPDPHNRLLMRYFDGTAWTRHAVYR